MKFVSTRGTAPDLGFCDAVLSGLASDGGLYVPAQWPQFTPSEIAGFAGQEYWQVALAVIAKFVDGEIADEDLKEIVKSAYEDFGHPSVAPISEIAPNHFLLELYHGPTLAFKDVAMQFLARTMAHILSQRGQQATIVGATSGDTGSAAIEAFRGLPGIDIFILHPHGRTSAIQRKQMTTVLDANVHNIALEGSFDDCQTAVKSMFANQSFRDEVQLSGVNSINWGRIVAQIVYYFTAAVSLGAPHRPISFCVPTGNFGDIFAGFAAKQMGLNIETLQIATNQNDILARCLETGAYEIHDVHQSISPSMDIQISSNFERLLFEASGRDPEYIIQKMSALKQSGRFELGEKVLKFVRSSFGAGRVSETETETTIAQTYLQTGKVLDPHTAVGVKVGQDTITNTDAATVPMVTLATADAAKFPDAVHKSAGIMPQLPQRLSKLNEKEERFEIMSNDQNALEAFVRDNLRR